MKIKKIHVPINYNEDLTIEAVFIGAGAFAKCYRVNDSVYSFIKIPARGEVDYSKEILSEIDSYNPHIPSIDRLGENNHLEHVYKMPFYKKLTAQDSAYQHAKKLIKLFESELYNGIYNFKNGYDSFFVNQKFIELCKIEKIPDSIVEALELINDSASNHGSYYQFEFALRNLKISESGDLILLDVLFNRLANEQLKQKLKVRNF